MSGDLFSTVSINYRMNGGSERILPLYSLRKFSQSEISWAQPPVSWPSVYSSRKLETHQLRSHSTHLNTVSYCKRIIGVQPQAKTIRNTCLNWELFSSTSSTSCNTADCRMSPQQKLLRWLNGICDLP